MKYIFAFLLLANASFMFAQGDAIQSEEIEIEDVNLKSGDIQLQPVTGVQIATNGLPGEGAPKGLVCRFPSSAPPQEPKYVIDGVLKDVAALKELNPNDIVSISVLKCEENSIGLCRGSIGETIIVKTKNGLTKRELRKQKREQRKAARKQTAP